MIPIRKLERLPRHQRLRKLLKLFEEAERFPDTISANYSYIQDCIALLVKDDLFSAVQTERIAQDSAAFSKICDSAASGAEAIPRPELDAAIRIVNSLRHMLLSETGQQVADWDFIDHSGALDTRSRQCFSGTAIYLEDIRSPYNVGAIFRTVESFGIERILLSGFCADPCHPRAMRSAMGCIASVPYAKADVHDLPGPVFAMETGGIPLNRFQFPRSGTLIVGSEELGVSPEALALADSGGGRVSIPCRGAKGSLNVSVAFGIVAQAWSASLGGGRD